MQFLSCLRQLNELYMISNWYFLWPGKKFLYLIYLLHLFYIKSLSQKPFLLIMNTQSWGGFHLFWHYSIYLKSMLIKSWVYIYIYKNLNHICPCSLSQSIQSRPNRVCEFCLVNICTHLFEMMCHLYFSRYKLFNYKSVHIIKPNVLHLKKDFFLFFFLPFW